MSADDKPLADPAGAPLPVSSSPSPAAIPPPAAAPRHMLDSTWFGPPGDHTDLLKKRD